MRNFFTFLICLIIAAGGYLGWQGIRFLSQAPSDTKTEVLFEMPAGASLSGVAQRLVENGLIVDEFKFKVFAKLTGEEGAIKVGEYRLFTDMTPRQVLNVLTSGQSVLHDVVIPEGFNIFDIRDLLNLKWPGRGDEFFKLATDPEYVKRILGTTVGTLEGYLFPDTYQVTRFTPASELIESMYKRFHDEINRLGPAQVRMNLHEHVTLASVIEKETGAPEERPLISAVFHNRLQKKMKLQSDPTIIYGIARKTGELKKNIKKDDILAGTPYNTYTIPALPAGPIANPGRDSLWAAVNPTSSGALYFVSRNDGTHVFSETLEKHNQAVREFQLNRSSREGKSWRDLNKKTNKEKVKSKSEKIRLENRT